MEIQKQKNLYLAKLLEQEVIKQDEFEDLVFKLEINAFHSNYLSSRFMDNINFGWSAWQAAKTQAVPEGFVLVPKAGAQYFSHDFNGDGFKYHDTFDEAKKEAEVNLDWYRDQVADGRHVNDMGEFNELSYGLVIGSAEYSIDHVVTQDDIDKGEYSYEVGTEILSLYLSEPREQSHE